MDDKTYVEFPIGDSGKMVVVREPSPSQLLMLAMTRAPKDGDTAGALNMAKRVFRLLEVLTGDQWNEIIEEGLMMEEITVLQVTSLITDVAGFDWASVRRPSPVGEPDPVSTPVAPNPGPRVVPHA